MRQVVWIAALLCGAVLLLAPITPAQAQATRTWVSGVGDDANPCSRTAPCKTFAGAISKTAAGGEINCLDPGGFGGVTITKAMTIDCSYTEGGALVGASNGIVVSAGATDVVTLRGLDIFAPIASPGLNGIRFNTGAALSVEKCVIRQFKATSPAPAGFGILFAPSGTSELYVTDSVLSNNGSGPFGGAIIVRPSGSGSAKATIDRTSMLNNASGITADTGAGPTSGNVFMTVHNSISSGNSLTGISAVSGAATGTAIIIVERTGVTNNTTGLSVSGVSAGMVVGTSTIAGNATGVNAAVGSGGIHTFGTNHLTNNSLSDGAFTPPVIPPQ